MLEMDVRISGGIFLLSLTYWSNCCMTARRRASTSLCISLPSAATSGVTVAVKWDSPSSMRFTLARCWPSTSTLTVPSGSFSICKMVETQPTSNMSDTAGSSLAAVFCATSMIRRSASIAASSALMLLGRPTNSGITMCGKTTTSRNGNNGRSIGVAGSGMFPDMGVPRVTCSIWSSWLHFQPAARSTRAERLKTSSVVHLATASGLLRRFPVHQ